MTKPGLENACLILISQLLTAIRMRTSEIRRRHLEDFRKLFVEVVRLALELRLVKFGKLSIDGIKVRANAIKRKVTTYERMEPTARGIDGYVALGQEVKIPTKTGDRIGHRRRSGWRRNWRRRQVGRPTRRSNGSRRPTDGLMRCWDFGVSAFADSGRCKGSGIWCVWR